MPPSAPLSADSTNRVSEAAMLSCAAVAEMLDRHRLLDASSLDEARGLLPRFSDTRLYLRELTQRGWLTNFQSRLILQGRANQLVLGPYVVLEKVGEGGMGAVYKARRTRPDRVVAIKIMRRERAENQDMVRRFHREVEVASTLSHPNVVRALDAIEVEGSLIFEMEYIEGINLTQLVQKRGPLPVPMACDFIRQAALGLQHAFEKGLVHRDIKPSNLFVTRRLDANVNGQEPSPYGIIKVLDLGLALIQPREGEREKTRLTQLGKVVGTTDFLAPEQARNAHEVDIRADLYALGCTFYFLLAGDVPFPEGAAMEKLLKHQLDEPTAIEARRRGLPAGLGDLVRKLMAKRPEDRCQTPGEVAKQLEPYARGEEPAPNATRLDTASPPELPVLTARAPAAVTRPEPVPFRASEPVPIAMPPLLATDSAVEVPKSDVMITRRLRTAALTRRMPVPLPRSRSRATGLWVALIVLLLAGLGTAIFLAIRKGAAPTQSSDNEKRPPAGSFALDDLNAAQIPADERIAGQPAELVAVLGEHRWHMWGNGTLLVTAPDGRHVATAGGSDPCVRLWDVATGKETAAYTLPAGARPEAIAVRGNGGLVALSNPAGSADVTVWDAASRQGKTKANGTRSAGQKVLSPDGMTLALVGSYGEGAEAIWSVKLLDIDADKEHPLFQVEKGQSLRALTFSPNGKWLAGVVGKRIKLWNVNGREVVAFPEYDAQIAGLAISPDGTMVASSASVTKDKGTTGELRLWDVDAKKEKWALSEPNPPAGLTFHPDSHALAASVIKQGQARIAVWDIEDRKERSSFGPVPASSNWTILSDFKSVVTMAPFDSSLRLWTTSGDHAPRPPFTAAAFAPDGTTLALLSAANPMEPSAGVWDFSAGKFQELGRHRGPGGTLQFVGDGKHLACANSNGATIWDTTARREENSFKPPDKTTDQVSILPDGRHALLHSRGTAAEAQYHIWDIRKKEELTKGTLPKGVHGPPAFTDKGKTMALCTGGKGDNIRFYDLETLQEKRTLQDLKVPAGTQPVLSADGTLLVMWGGQNVKVLDAATGREHAAGPIVKTTVRTVTFAPSGHLFAFVTIDGHVTLWDADTRRVREMAMPGPVMSLSFAADGRHLATLNANGTVYILRIPKG
jgi:serine/threonine-protein kinase